MSKSCLCCLHGKVFHKRAILLFEFVGLIFMKKENFSRKTLFFLIKILNFRSGWGRHMEIRKTEFHAHRD